MHVTSNREKLLHYLRMAMASEVQSVRVSAEKYGGAAGALRLKCVRKSVSGITRKTTKTVNSKNAFASKSI